MNREEIKNARTRLMNVSVAMEAVRFSEYTPDGAQGLHDAILELSQVCRLLVSDAEKSLIQDPREYWATWLDQEPVGAYVKDNTDDIWRKDGENAWRCWDPVDKCWDNSSSPTSDLVAWKPYTETRNPERGECCSPRSRQEAEAWLRRRAVGTLVEDRDGYQWLKEADGRWVLFVGGERNSELKTVESLAPWHPFYVVDGSDLLISTVPEAKIKVGDVLTTKAQTATLAGRWGTVLQDSDGDAWVLREADSDRGYAVSGWYCSHPNLRDCDLDDMASYFPYTVLYLPD